MNLPLHVRFEELEFVLWFLKSKQTFMIKIIDFTLNKLNDNVYQPSNLNRGNSCTSQMDGWNLTSLNNPN